MQARCHHAAGLVQGLAQAQGYHHWHPGRCHHLQREQRCLRHPVQVLSCLQCLHLLPLGHHQLAQQQQQTQTQEQAQSAQLQRQRRHRQRHSRLQPRLQ
jgi:hypothetical protein